MTSSTETNREDPRPRRRARFRSALLLATATAALFVAAAPASATTLTIGCSGKGPAEAASEVSDPFCAVAPGQKRTVEGVLRNDHGKAVSGTLVVTFSTYIPHGGGSFAVTPQRHFEVHASASGKFKIPVTAPNSETALYIEALGDEKQESSGIAQQVEIKRYVTATARKLGHGKVAVTVTGVSDPLKIGLTIEGDPAPGGALRKARNGVAIFSVGALHGEIGIVVDVGPDTDLFYVEANSFKL